MYDAAKAGLGCLYLGCEITQEEWDARSALLARRRGDVIDDELRAVLSNIRYADLASTLLFAWKEPDAWRSAIASAYAVVAIDPLSSAGSALDLDFIQSNSDYTRWYDRLVQPPVSDGAAFVLADNIALADNAKGRAKGASAKAQKADLTLITRRSANPVGLILEADKVRSVRAPFTKGDAWIITKEGQTFEAHTRNATSDATDAGGFRPTAVMGKVSRTVEQTPGLSKTAIRDAVGGTAKWVDLGLELLIAEDFIESREERPAHRHYSVRPYREEDEETKSAEGDQVGPSRSPSRRPETPTDVSTESAKNPHERCKSDQVETKSDQVGDSVPATKSARDPLRSRGRADWVSGHAQLDTESERVGDDLDVSEGLAVRAEDAPA